MQPVELSFVIPVFNAAATIGPVVERIHALYDDLAFEIVLVNDGSTDDSEQACPTLAARYPATVVFLHLARNFGEHNAVLAGLNHARGRYVAILDDDGQNPPEEVRRAASTRSVDSGHDVVYGRYRVKHHAPWRNLGSRFNDHVANVMLRKPRDLYLSSFKIINRFIVDEVTRYKGAFPYIDGLILRTTRNIGQVDVEHRAPEGRARTTRCARCSAVAEHVPQLLDHRRCASSALLGRRPRRSSACCCSWRSSSTSCTSTRTCARGLPTVLVVDHVLRRRAAGDPGHDRRVSRPTVPRPFRARRSSSCATCDAAGEAA